MSKNTFTGVISTDQIEIKKLLNCNNFQDLQGFDNVNIVRMYQNNLNVNKNVQIMKQSYYAQNEQKEFIKSSEEILNRTTKTFNFENEQVQSNTDITDKINFKLVNKIEFLRILEKKYKNYKILLVAKEISKDPKNILHAAIDFFKLNPDKLEFNLSYECFDKKYIKEIKQLFTYNEREQYITEIKIYLKSYANTLKKLLNNPLNLTHNNISSLTNYYVLEKTDGKRCCVILKPKQYIILTEENLFVENHDCNITETYYLDAEKADKIKIFDLIDNNSGNYENRIKILQKIDLPENLILKTALIANEKNIKTLYFANSSKNAIDGLIFNSNDANYKNTKIYKWKPAELTTFDFLVLPIDHIKFLDPIQKKINTNNYMLMSGSNLSEFKEKYGLFKEYEYLLKNFNITRTQYAPVPFMVEDWPASFMFYSDKKLGKCVAEFKISSLNQVPSLNLVQREKEWEMIKIREDKTLLIDQGVYGNNYKVALEMYDYLKNPISLEELCEHFTEKQGSSYFVKRKSREYSSMIAYNNQVKFQVMSRLRKFNNVLDIASGKGNDIFIYNGLEIKNMTFVEPDLNAMQELKRRYTVLHVEKFYKYTAMPKTHLQARFYLETFESFYSKYPEKRFDAIVCNFACHYFLNTPEDYETFSDMCRTYKANTVILTFLDYDAVKKVLSKNKNFILQNAKYFIEQKDNKLYIKHHFNDEIIPENIVDTDLLIKKMSDFKVERVNFGKFMNEIIIPDMDELDREYCSLYQYVVFTK